MIKTLDKTAIILSGGKNSRMNYKNKAFLKIYNTNFIEIILKKVSAFKEIIIVSNNPLEYNHLGVKVVKDILPSKGPLSGIHAGLTHASYQQCLVIPCDMPFVRKGFLEYLGNLNEDYDAIVPKTGQYLQPLCAIYNKRCINPIEKSIEKGRYKIVDLYQMIKIKFILEEEIKHFGKIDETFRNINMPMEYNEFCLIERSS